MAQSYTGVSFPFRIGVKGGVVMSTTSVEDIQHITEGVQQLVQTRDLERTMEQQIRCNASVHLFDPNDESLRTLVAEECREAIENCDKRVEVVDITTHSVENTVYADVLLKVKKYERTYAVNVKVGEF